MTSPLLPEKTLVESQLFTLENISVTAAALSRAGRDDSIETTSLELLLQSGLGLSGRGETLRLLLLNALRLLLLLLLLAGLGLPPAAESSSVVSLEPLSERSSIDLDDGGLGEGVGTDELVVGGMVDDTDDTGLLGDAFRSPCEVAGVEAEGTEFAVAATGADKMDTLSSNTGIGWLATLLESPKVMLDMTIDAIGLCIPLLAVVCSLGTGGRALVTRVSGDTVGR